MQSSNSPNATTHEVNQPTGIASAAIVPELGGKASSESQIEALSVQLERARRMATLGELTSTTTHEFNNLLMTILNYAKVGLRHKDEASRDKAFQRILDAATKAGKITGSVLAMARSRSDQREPTCLKTLIEDTLLLIEREYRKFRIGLEVNLEETPEINVVRNDIQRLMVNLLINARQATPEQGSVRVSLQFDAAQDEAILVIRDNGRGIESDVLRCIFDPFFSTKSGPDATGRGGTGVGLYTCKQIIDEHAGRIRVESTVGKGTAFIMRLPRDAQASKKTAKLDIATSGRPTSTKH